MPTFIVESYAASGIVSDQQRRAELVAAMATGIRYVRTTIMPGDQTLLHLFEATSSDVLREAVLVAALECDRIVEVFETSPDRTDAGPPDGRASSPPDEEVQSEPPRRAVRPERGAST